MYFQGEGCIVFQLGSQGGNGWQIVETTANRQMELAFDTFCVGGTKKMKIGERSIFFVPPTQKVSNASSF
jgi:hypothetical protein